MVLGKNVLVAGGSRGIGLGIAERLVRTATCLWCVSRSPSPHGEWIAADLATGEGVMAVADRLGGERLDALLYFGGTWERDAFTTGYGFERGDRAEMERVLAVNLLAPIHLVHALLPALRRSSSPRALFIGSLSGLDNAASREVANSASKSGLRGAAGALRRELPWLAVTVLNPGNVATPEVEEDIAVGRFGPQVPIPMDDVAASVAFAISLSPAAVATEINLSQMA
ncbi:SDR family oxidoreductase (plasmid) [Roseomonas sp. CCTCC AB2023176]|uniref:SDR family oxidoreductase n=1 Tax=Roseomonas sp. CCTCC AB2023176 TaxID=3342640 RepID=UPI0035DF85D2